MPDPVATELSSPPEKHVSQKPRLSIARRVGFGLSGALLVVGFFLPWLTAGSALELSGLGLVFAGGDVVSAVSGTGRFLLVIVPLLGAGLIFGAISGHRVTSWVAALGAGALLIFGLAHVISLFISSTGMGMWMVVLASLLALVLGLLSVGRATAK